MKMAQLARSYLEQTSAHGFGRLLSGDDRGNGGRFRWLWAVAIAASFTAAGVFVITSVQEAHLSPVATDIEYVPTHVSLGRLSTENTDKCRGCKRKNGKV